MPLDTASLKAAIHTSFANQNAGIEQVLATLKRLPAIGNAATTGVLIPNDRPLYQPASVGQLKDLTNVLHRLDDTTKEAAYLKRACKEALLPQPTTSDSTPTKVCIPAVTPPHTSRYKTNGSPPEPSPSGRSPQENGCTPDPAEARPVLCSNCQQMHVSMQDMRRDLDSFKACSQSQASYRNRCSSASPNGSTFALASAEEALVAAKAEVVEKSAQCEALQAKLEVAQRALGKLSKLVADAAKDRVASSPRGSEGARQEFVELMELQGLCSAVQLRGSGLQVANKISSQGAQIDAMLEAALAQVKDLKAEMMMEWDEYILSPAGNSLRNEPLTTPSSRSLPDHPDHHTAAARALSHDPPPTPPPFSSTPTTPADAATGSHPYHPHHHHLYQPPNPPFLSQPPHAAAAPAPTANGITAPPPSAATSLEDPLADLTFSLDAPVHLSANAGDFADPMVDLPLGVDPPLVSDAIPQLPPGIPAFHELPPNFQDMFYHDREEFWRIIDEFQRMLQSGPPV